MANSQTNPLAISPITTYHHQTHLIFSPASLPSFQQQWAFLFPPFSFLLLFHDGKHILVGPICKIRPYQVILRHLLHNIHQFCEDPWWSVPWSIFFSFFELLRGACRGGLWEIWEGVPAELWGFWECVDCFGVDLKPRQVSKLIGIHAIVVLRFLWIYSMVLMLRRHDFNHV